MAIDFSKFVRRTVGVALAVALWMAGSAHAASGSAPLKPLSADEVQAVVGEIQRMLKTNEDRVVDFVVREATPDRIERLYQMPELTKLPKGLRENGLIFAGRGSTLLSFDKPSDVIAKVSAWFPEEIARARATRDQRLWSGDVGLWGPFENWDAEPAAFLALWNCMPGNAWLRPGENPFARRSNDGLFLYPMAARQSSYQEFDFGYCVRERSGYRGGMTMEQHRENQAKVHKMSERVTPLLRSKFASLLNDLRCGGTGPDDCVLILRLWASLSPTDAALAAAMQRLEPDIAPDSPLPELRKPYVWGKSDFRDGEERYGAGLRRAAYLRAKLLSVLSAPNAWPTNALAATLHQMTGLRQAFADPFVSIWYQYEIDYRNDPINPWLVLFAAPDKAPQVRSAIMSEVDSLPAAAQCDLFKQWFDHGGESLRTVYALKRLSAGHSLHCVAPDWDWLKAGKSADALELRGKYLDLLDSARSGAVHEMLLSEFTNQGESCFDRQGEASQDWLRKVCKTWISEPQAVPFILQHSRLTLNAEDRFRATQQQLPADSDGTSWLTQLVQGMSGEAQQKARLFVADLKRHGASISAATRWDHARYDKSLIELQLSKSDLPTGEPGRTYSSERILVVLAALNIAFSDIPPRFRGRHEDGEIVQVSDLDQDGNLELWFAESFRTCHGNETDLERDIDCSSRTADMGEINGDFLSYFAYTPSAGKPLQARKTPTAASLAAADKPARTLDEQRPCNAVLVGTVLGDALGISFNKRSDDGNVIDLVCKTHPLHPEQTIVALFHDLQDAQGGEAEEGSKGFALAVLDVKRRKLISLYRSNIAEDASTRIDAFSLQIDTGRYTLAPGVRALGVRMNIGHSPNCAEGGESNYLTLFVEQGRRLKPVLKDLPMRHWTVTQGGNGCGNGDADYTTDKVELTLAVVDTVTNGWHDLEVVAHHQIETQSAGAEAPVKQQARQQVLGKLRAKGKMYSGDGWVRSSLWPGQ